MTLDAHILVLERATKELAASQVDDNLLSTLDMIALIKIRWADQGLRADGSNFSDYTEPYAKKRQKLGLKVSAKDFNVTGELYRSIRPEVKSNGFGEVQIDIVPRGDNQLKVAGQFKKDGNILEPSPNEIQEVTLAHSRRRITRAQQLFNG